jgi:hypothetical protein
MTNRGALVNTSACITDHTTIMTRYEHTLELAWIPILNMNNVHFKYGIDVIISCFLSKKLDAYDIGHSSFLKIFFGELRVFIYVISRGINYWFDPIRHNSKINWSGMALIFLTRIGPGRVGFGLTRPDPINYVFWSNFVI